jgi:tetratricopeptide (TPR) repeat protein
MSSPNTSRLDAFRGMVAKNPKNALAHFGLANEAVKAGLLEEAAEHYRAYLAAHDDEGNGWQRLGEALTKLGRPAEAREAFEKGIAASNRFGHPGMAAEIQDLLDAMS